MFPFRTCLNASTLFPFRIDLAEQLRVAAEAGYDGIEIWVRDVDAYLAAGHTLADLRQAAQASGVAVANAIAFFPWADASGAARERGFEQAKREMDMLAEIGCHAIAAAPYGDVDGVSLDAIASCFARLYELGASCGVEPYLEFWGRAKRLRTLSEALYVAAASGVTGAKLLLDPFHMYTGGSPIEGVAYVHGDRIGIVHVNDYPAAPVRSVIRDGDRVFPGDGVAPSGTFAKLLDQVGYAGYLSLELFIDDFGGRSALDVAAEGLGKIRSAYDVEPQ